jgi:hypothetical protein
MTGPSLSAIDVVDAMVAKTPLPDAAFLILRIGVEVKGRQTARSVDPVSGEP